MRIFVVLLLFCSVAHGQIVDRFTPFPTSSENAIEALNPVNYWTSRDLAGSAGASVTSLTDKGSAGITLTSNASGGDPIINVATYDGVKEIEHTGVEFFVDLTDDAVMEYGPTDVQTIVVILGEDSPDGYMVNKGTNLSATTDTEYSMRAYSTGDASELVFNGVADYGIDPTTTKSDVLVLVKISDATADYWVSGTESAAVLNPGVVAAGDGFPFRIGSRGHAVATTVASGFTGTWRDIAIYDKVLSDAEIATITDEFATVYGTNPNPNAGTELIDDGAMAFQPDEANSTTGASAFSGGAIAAVSDTSNEYGDYVAELTTTANAGVIKFDFTAATNTTYDVILYYRYTSGGGNGVVSPEGTGHTFDATYENLGATEWTQLDIVGDTSAWSGTFRVNVIVDNTTGATSGDTMQVKVSVQAR